MSHFPMHENGKTTMMWIGYGLNGMIKSKLPLHCQLFHNNCVDFENHLSAKRLVKNSSNPAHQSKMHAVCKLVHSAFNTDQHGVHQKQNRESNFSLTEHIAGKCELLVQLIITRLCTLLTPKPLKLVMMLVTSIVRKANFGSIFKSTQIGTSISEWKKMLCDQCEFHFQQCCTLEGEKTKASCSC